MHCLIFICKILSRIKQARRPSWNKNLKNYFETHMNERGTLSPLNSHRIKNILCIDKTRMHSKKLIKEKFS